MTTSNKREKNSFYKFVNNPWVIFSFNMCSAVGLIVSCTSENPICITIFGTLTFIFILIVVFYLIYRAVNLKKTKANIEATHIAKNKLQYEKMHSFQHDLRNYTNYLDKNNNISFDNFRDKARVLCDIMEPIFSSVLQTQEKVSVCLKYIETDTFMNKDYKNWEICTLARSQSTQRVRLAYDDKNRKADLIADNTDFEVIVSCDSKFQNFNRFACGDLDSYASEFQHDYMQEFKNSHENPPYKSTIVIPIRIASEYLATILENANMENQFYHVLGFLCIDSEEKFLQNTNDYRYNRFKNCEELACSFADSLYDFFESYFMQEIIKRIDVKQISFYGEVVEEVACE